MPRRPTVATPPAVLVYKFAELSIVTSETLEECVNTWVAEGWTFDGVRFVTSEASRRPAMAFVSFVREQAPGDAADAAPEPRAAPVTDPAPTPPSPSTSRRRR